MRYCGKKPHLVPQRPSAVLSSLLMPNAPHGSLIHRPDMLGNGRGHRTGFPLSAGKDRLCGLCHRCGSWRRMQNGLSLFGQQISLLFIRSNKFIVLITSSGIEAVLTLGLSAPRRMHWEPPQHLPPSAAVGSASMVHHLATLL